MLFWILDWGLINLDAQTALLCASLRDRETEIRDDLDNDDDGRCR